MINVFNLIKFILVLSVSAAAIFLFCRLLNKKIKLSEMQKRIIFTCLAAVSILFYFLIENPAAFYYAVSAAGGALVGWSLCIAYTQ